MHKNLNLSVLDRGYIAKRRKKAARLAMELGSSLRMVMQIRKGRPRTEAVVNGFEIALICSNRG